MKAKTDMLQARLNAGSYETARREAIAALKTATGPEAVELRFQLHAACRKLNDIRGCKATLAVVVPETSGQKLELLLRQAEDCKLLGKISYSESDERKQGLSHWEYFDRMDKKGKALLEEARALVERPEQQERFAQASAICNEGVFSAVAKSVNNVVAPPSPARRGKAGLTGRITFADGTPADGLTVTLGLEVAELPPDPKRYTNTNLEVYEPAHSPVETVTCVSDHNGCYVFENLPAGTHEFLSVNLHPQKNPIAVWFLAHHIELRDGETHKLDARILEWTSAPARPAQAALAETIPWPGGAAALVATDKLLNPFDFTFPQQLLEMDLPEGISPNPAHLLLQSSDHPGVPVPFQISGKTILYFSDLPANHDRFYGLYHRAQAMAQPDDSRLKLAEAGPGVVLVTTGRAAFRLPGGEGSDLLPPILQVKGADGVWRGKGRLFLPEGVSLASRKTTVLEPGPLRLQVRIHYELSNGMSYSFKLTFHRDEPYVLVHETSPALDGAGFEFSLAEFLGGRYFHNGHTPFWKQLAPNKTTIGRLKEHQNGVDLEAYGLLMSKDSVEEKDCVGVFTIRRGEWIDRAFDKVCHGPARAGYSHEQEWPYPEMIGSTISMITAETGENDCLFRFNTFDGERHWGLMVSSFDDNDGRFNALSEYQQKNSSPRLQDFKQWRLDLPSAISRPSILVQAERLPELRRRKTDPRFAEAWKKIEAMRPNGGGQWEPSAAGAFRAMLNADPRQIWNKKRELTSIAGPHAKSVLLCGAGGAEFSPVAARAVPPWIEDYDLIAATGVFTDEEEQLVRAHHMLMGHMYLQKDHMNWMFNARNANFESDRVDAVAIAGLCFRDNPDGRTFVAHAQSRIAKIIETYTTPGSGKWYENPACYYLVSVKNWSSLFVHLAHHGLIRIEDVPTMKEFLRWGVLLLTPPTPDYNAMRDGLSPEAYKTAARKRRIAPIGDHASLGQSIPETYPLVGACYRGSDPEFADLLRWAYYASGADGAYHGQPLLFFANADEWMLTPPPASPELPSRRLEGFGAVFRGNQNRSNESYLLLKLGPGGYRYHSTEGSVIFFADGKPLLYDGGEAGETWRHSTLSFYDTHTMLAPGHVERFFDSETLGFTQGVSPKALKPGEENYLSHRCRPEDAETGYRSYHEPNPAISRSLFWVKDDYLVMHDALDLAAEIPTHWHLQVVGDADSGNLETGWLFKGRFGTDLQVLMPAMTAAEVAIKQTPFLDSRPDPNFFSMRHLQVTGKPGTSRYLAVLRPLAAGQGTVTAEAITQDGLAVGAAVRGTGIDDILILDRKGLAWKGAGVSFKGRYGAVIARPDKFTLALIDGQELEYKGIRITSDGPAVQVEIQGDDLSVVTSGSGNYAITRGNQTQRYTIRDRDHKGCTLMPMSAFAAAVNANELNKRSIRP